MRAVYLLRHHLVECGTVLIHSEPTVRFFCVAL